MGFPYALVYHDGSTTATYYYIINLQGDVMYLVDASGNQVAAYSYDPYGKVLTSRGVMAEINPLRYRGYYQDNETGFYYLQSRYYDPAICRFINADSYTSTGQGYLGYNAFAYCNNDPVNRTDADGEFFDIIFDVISIGFSIADVVQNPTDPWAWIGLVGDVVDVVVPFVSGVGETTKAVGAVADVADVMDDVHDAAKTLDNVDDVLDAGKSIEKISDAAEDTSQVILKYGDEIKMPNQIKSDQAVAAWDDFLGPNQTSFNKYTGKYESDRIFSADGNRSIRFGNHEMNSIGGKKAHFHYEEWTYSPNQRTVFVSNRLQRIK